MNAKVITLLAAIMGLAALSGCGENSQARGEAGTEDGASGNALTLEIGGSSQTEFSGACAVGDAEPEEIGGRIPQSFTYDLAGKPLECEIASEDRLEVTLVHDNNRSVQRTSGGTLSLAYDNGSISTSTSSQVGSSSSSSEDELDGTPDGSGNVASEAREVAGFDEVELRGIGNLSIRQTGAESLTVEAEDDVLPKVRTEVVDDRLIIGPEPNASVQINRPINYELTVEDLHVLTLSGSGTTRAEGVRTDTLTTTIDGTGSVEISGRTDSQEVYVAGSGAYRAEALESRRAKADVKGTGSAVVNASEELDARVSGAGSVEYLGDPTVKEDVSGVGRIDEH